MFNLIKQRLKLIAILSLIFPIKLVLSEEISVGTLVTANQRTTYEALFRQFTKETGIKVNFIPKPQSTYNQSMHQWLVDNKGTPDVVYWYSSQRLFKYAKSGLVLPLTELWKNQDFDENFSLVKHSVTFDNEIYGIPFSYYNWGIFYNKKLTNKYGGPKDNWDDFINQCIAMKKDGLIPISLGLKNKWPAGAWFDYVNFRVNGLAFHQELLAGKVPFTDSRIMEVFVELKRLIDNNLFTMEADEFKWSETLPYIYRDLSVFTLSGSFIQSQVPKQILPNIDYMNFPKIKDIPRYEDAPLDIFLIPLASKNKETAKKLITFLARKDIQTEHNNNIGYLSPNKFSQPSDNYLVKKGFHSLKGAAGIAQYFDRDTMPAFEKKATPIISNFLIDGNIEQAIEKLEAARLSVFSD